MLKVDNTNTGMMAKLAKRNKQNKKKCYRLHSLGSKFLAALCHVESVAY